LSCYPKAISGKVGIISGSGGHGALAVDVCAAQGLKVPALTDAQKKEIRKQLSTSIQTIAALDNPIDLTGSAVDDDFVSAAKAISQVAGIDSILVLLLPYLPGITSDLGARLSTVSRWHKKPMVAYVPHVEKYRMLIEGFELNRIPVSSSLEGAVLMIEAMRRCQPC
jgi:acyl-CoA synthetase (NDP forming)